MATDDRPLKFENAFATISELAARSDTRTSRLEQSLILLTELALNTHEHLDDHQQSLNDHQQSLNDHQQRLDIHQQHLDDHKKWIESRAAAQASWEAKMAVLADAQIQTQKSLDALIRRPD